MAAATSTDSYASDAFDVSADASGNMQVSVNASAQHDQAIESIALQRAEERNQSTPSHSSDLDLRADLLLNSAREADELLMSFGIPLHAFEDEQSSLKRVTVQHDSNTRKDVLQSSVRHVAFKELAQRVRTQSAKQSAALSHESLLQQQQQQAQSQLCDALVPAECAQALLQRIAVNNSSCKLSQKQQQRQQQLQRSHWPLHGPLFCASHRLSHASGCSSRRCMPALSRRCPFPSELVGRVQAGTLQSRLQRHTAPALDAHDAAMRAWTQQRRTASADAHPQLAAALYTRAATARVRQQAAAHRGSAAESSGAVHAAGAPLLLLARMLRGVPATVEPDSYRGDSFNEPHSSSSNRHSRSTYSVHERSSTTSSTDNASASSGDNRLSAEQQQSLTAVAVTELLVQSRALREQCSQTFANNTSNNSSSSSSMQTTQQQQTDSTQQHCSGSSDNAAVHTTEQFEIADGASQRMTAQEAQQVLEQSQQLRADCAQASLFGLRSCCVFACAQNAAFHSNHTTRTARLHAMRNPEHSAMNHDAQRSTVRICEC
eukprot:11076-Heterococcus_DN1.PRE.1